MIPIYADGTFPYAKTFTIYVHSTHYPDFLKNQVLRYYKNVTISGDLIWKGGDQRISFTYSIEKDNINLTVQDYNDHFKLYNILEKVKNVNDLYNFIIRDTNWRLGGLILNNEETDICVKIITTRRLRGFLSEMIHNKKRSLVGYLPMKFNLRNTENVIYLDALLGGYYQKIPKNNEDTDMQYDDDGDSDYIPSTDEETEYESVTSNSNVESDMEYDDDRDPNYIPSTDEETEWDSGTNDTFDSEMEYDDDPDYMPTTDEETEWETVTDYTFESDSEVVDDPNYVPTTNDMEWIKKWNANRYN